MPWKRMLAYITGSVNKELLRCIEYLLEESRILRRQIDNNQHETSSPVMTAPSLEWIAQFHCR